MTFDIHKEIVAQAKEYWDDESMPLLRLPTKDDHILILGWSTGQDQSVLLAWQPDPDEDFGEAAAKAAEALPEDLPDGFTCDGDVVAKLKSGFYDGNGDWYSEITFQEEWHATLLQAWLDDAGHHICILPSEKMSTDKTITDHVNRAGFNFDRTIRYAAFKAMSLQYEARQYTEDYLTNQGQLPLGSHTLPSGAVVFFNAPPVSMDEAEASSLSDISP